MIRKDLVEVPDDVRRAVAALLAGSTMGKTQRELGLSPETFREVIGAGGRLTPERLAFVRARLAVLP